MGKGKKDGFGVDLHLFDDKFTVTLDYFKDKRDGIFQERQVIPDYVGLIQKPYGNVGSMRVGELMVISNFTINWQKICI